MIGEVFMIKRLKKDYGWVIGMGMGILVIFFFLRMINLTILPVFADEAIYIRWSQVMSAESTLRFLPLSDGKQPLFMWILMPLLSFFRDPLVAGRILSVFSGLVTMVGVFLLSFSLFRFGSGGRSFNQISGHIFCLAFTSSSHDIVVYLKKGVVSEADDYSRIMD